MAIKKSDLEKKWYYRLAKSLFLILPLLILLFLFFNKSVSVCYVPQNNLLDLFQKYLVYILIGLVLYFLIITAIWRIFVYIIFGGLEDGQQTAIKSEPNKKRQLLPLIIILILIAIFFALYKAGYLDLNNFKVTPNPSHTPKPGPTCYTTSAQWGHPCHSVSGGVGVYGLPVPDYCNCPTDTSYRSMDNTTPGGPYKICVCK